VREGAGGGDGLTERIATPPETHGQEVMMKTSLRFMLMVPLATAGLACSSNPEVSIGDPVGAALTDYAASWDGYAEAYQFQDQSDRIRLVVDGSGVGTLQVGDSAAVPPATDPDAAYPPAAASLPGKDGLFGPIGLYAGFGYPIHGTRVEDSRIRFGVDPKDLYTTWCALQQPVLDTTNGGYMCVPNWGFSYNTTECSQTNPTTQETTVVSCAKLSLCELDQACTCTASACVAASTPDNPPIQLDAALSANGTELTGTLVIDGQRVTVRMHR
jgi:hypothetical protein